MANEPLSERRIGDAKLRVNVALPNAGNTVNTNAIDLGSNTPFPVTDQIQVKLSTTAGNGANNKNINCRLQHSNESNANFVNIAELGVLTVVDNNGAGYSASSLAFSLPATTRRYIRGQGIGEANGGNAANGTLTVELLF